jgi:pimeloyl-ACP methyl ester carboxylesterase
MSAAQPSAQPGLQPTVVLVHGAFADASSWNGVIERLQQQGCTVVAPANPLRGLAPDSAYIASVVNQIDGPVLLVGHSYGGAVITNAAATATGVVGLVFVAAFAPTKANAGSDVVRSMAQRAGADIVEVEGSHVIMVSQPQAVTNLILKAVRTPTGPRAQRP